MRETQPEIFLVAEPRINWDAVHNYMLAVDGMPWLNRVKPEGTRPILSDAELLVEFMARSCYRSWAPGLNANVTKVREDSTEYIRNVLNSGHGSVFEHAQFSFMFHNVSRVFTHELVRHRAGVAISQESLRYVRLTDLGFRIPEILEPLREQVVSIVEHLENFQREAAESFGLDDEGIPFHYKKEVTSALRRLAPIGLSTSIGWSANIRTLRWVIEQRTSAGAEEEIRDVFSDVARIMVERCPAAFGDFRQDDDGSWKPEARKV